MCNPRALSDNLPSVTVQRCICVFSARCYRLQLVRTIDLLFGDALEPMVVVLLIVFPLFMWAGVSFLLLLVKHHGSVAASAANVIRKVIAVGYSFIYFGRPITVPIAIGTLLVFGSVVWRAMAHDHTDHGKAAVTDCTAMINAKDVNPSTPNDAEDDDAGDEEASLLSFTPSSTVFLKNRANAL